jgi:nitrogen fixation/metabolism regulation signal transduction histidine kinase
MPYVSTSQKNMGLGLAIVHEIIIQAGGSIKLMDGQGAIFQILLPI